MLKVRVIPCMLFNGIQVVKTIQFNNPRNLGPATQFAKVYNARNVDELIFIDFLATEQGRQPNFLAIKEVFEECFMPLTIGGGIHDMATVDRLMKTGADKVTIQSEALARPNFITEIAQKYGSQAVVISIDVKYENGEYHVFKNRGRKNAGVSLNEWIKEVETRGAGEIFLNSIDRDGIMQGYDLNLIQHIAAITSVPVIACGGAGKVQDIVDVINIGNASAAALGSMFHYTGHTPNSIKERMSKASIPVRLLRENYEG